MCVWALPGKLVSSMWLLIPGLDRRKHANNSSIKLFLFLNEAFIKINNYFTVAIIGKERLDPIGTLTTPPGKRTSINADNCPCGQSSSLVQVQVKRTKLWFWTKAEH